MEIPLAIKHDLDPLQLLELPLDLANVCRPDSRFDLKSGPASSVVLCTASSTYQLQQVHSSNSVFVIKPDTVDSVAAVAKCATLLELLPSASSAPRLLQERLPEWKDGPSLDTHVLSRRAISRETPLSEHEFDQVWQSLMAFEYKDQAYLPSAALQLKAWSSMKTAAQIEGTLPITAHIPPSFRQAFLDDGLPEGLYEPLVRKLESPEITVQWLGRLLVGSWSSMPCLRTEFMAAWQDLLPDEWYCLARIELLKVGLSVDYD